MVSAARSLGTQLGRPLGTNLPGDGVAPSFDTRMLALTSKFVWLRPDSAAIDVPSSKVTGLLDRYNPGHIFSQATTALQAATPVANANFNNQLVYAFPGTTETYQSNWTTAQWSPLHAVAGVRVWAVVGWTSLVNTSPIITTMNWSLFSTAGVTTGIGPGLAMVRSAAKFRCQLWSDTGALRIADSSVVGTIATNTAYVLSTAYQAGSFDVRQDNGSIYSAAVTGPSANPANMPAIIGATGGASVGGGMLLADLIALVNPSVADAQLVSDYIFDRYAKVA